MKAQLDPIRTLVADDSEDEFALLTVELRANSSLKLIGFVRDGLETIAYLRGVDKYRHREVFPYPDLLLLDFNMPRCDGMGVLAFLRHQFHRPRVVLWSTTLDQVNIARALQLGADLVCEKPGSHRELARILEQLDTKAFKAPPFTAPLVKVSESVCVNI